MPQSETADYKNSKVSLRKTSESTSKKHLSEDEKAISLLRYLFSLVVMKEEGYKIRDQSAIHFITFATIQWVDVFSRYCYVEVLLKSLRFCVAEKGLKIHAWCIMTNHVHLIVSAKNANLSDLIRDLKKFTSVEIIKQIESNVEESRRSWMLWIFKSAGKNNSRNERYQFWQQGFHPIELITPKFTLSKLEYVHQNPVKAAIVLYAESYLLSSAIDYDGGAGLLPIEHLDAAYQLVRYSKT